ncbi:hypothetical protein [Nonomuraea sp. NPDC005650]|uniref:hypothetical protein n=1 Tax=Nonomuraea sp. NPDC005650 TaxID=3157045 RepID=UPI0033A7E8BD
MTTSTSASATLESFPPADAWLGYLADDERVTPDNAAVLARADAILSEPPGDLARLFVGCNLLALLLYRVRRLTEATAVCRGEIALALRRRGTSEWPLAASLALQPQINLLRAEGFAGDFRRALHGLRELEELATGRPVRLPDLEIDDPMVAAMIRYGPEPLELARSACVIDTCKILWRRGLGQELIEASARLRRRWPGLVAAGGPAFAAEAPWLVSPLELAPPALDQRSPALRRLAFIRLLHVAAAAVQAGKWQAARRASAELLANREVAGGAFASPLTPLRWLASLGDTLLRLDLHEDAAGPLRQALNGARAYGETTLAGALAARLAVADPAWSGRPAERAAPTLADEFAKKLTKTVELAFSRLDKE